MDVSPLNIKRIMELWSYGGWCPVGLFLCFYRKKIKKYI